MVHMICRIVHLVELFMPVAFPCMFMSTMMPFSLMKEWHKTLGGGTYEIMRFCHFCCNWCVHLMSTRSTCVLNYNMTSLQGWLSCIFVINVVTRTSMKTRLRDIAVFRDLGFYQVIFLMLFWCHVYLMLQWDPCLFWVASVRMFWTYGYAYSSMPLFAIMECPSMS